MKTYDVGDRVIVDAVDGFSGAATVTSRRDVTGSHFKVRLEDGSQEFWAHDEELSPAPTYDSRVDTYEHIRQVQMYLRDVIKNLLQRSLVHDDSKLKSPEKDAFDVFTPKLKGSTYGSDEYKGFLAQMKPALDHHYLMNSHHPEHYGRGIRGMSLLDLIEMLCDWKAATLRHKDGDIRRSIIINKERFGYSDELTDILVNTMTELGL